MILLDFSWYILFHFGHLETMFYKNTKENGFTDEMSCYFSMTACGRKSAFRLQTKYKVCKVTRPALFRFFSGKECGEQLPLLVLKAPEKRSPEISSQYFRHFQWSGHYPFFPPSLVHERNLRHLEKSFPDCLLEVGWAGLTVILGSQIPREIWGLLSVAYNSSGLVYIENYSETDNEVVQIHSLHKSALTCKSAQAFMLYYLSKGDNWCEISKIKTPQPTRQKGNQALNRRYI